jgi:hypothetical protein
MARPAQKPDSSTHHATPTFLANHRLALTPGRVSRPCLQGLMCVAVTIYPISQRQLLQSCSRVGSLSGRRGELSTMSSDSVVPSGHLCRHETASIDQASTLDALTARCTGARKSLACDSSVLFLWPGRVRVSIFHCISTLFGLVTCWSGDLSV